MTSQSCTSLIPQALGLALIAGCGHNGNNVAILNPTAPTLFVYDQEPNNSPAFPQGVGPIGAFQQWRIEGYVDDKFGPYVDEVDAYAFAAAEPIDVEFGLYGEKFYAWDADLGLFDPFLGQWIYIWDTYDQDEFGAFVVDTFGEEFHMVVIAALGAGDYRLDLDVLPAYGFATKDAGPAAEALQLDGEPKAERAQAFADYAAAAEAARNLEQHGLPVGLLVEVDAAGEVQIQRVVARGDGALSLL